jgi:hypothetical protein
LFLLATLFNTRQYFFTKLPFVHLVYKSIWWTFFVNALCHYALIIYGPLPPMVNALFPLASFQNIAFFWKENLEGLVGIFTYSLPLSFPFLVLFFHEDIFLLLFCVRGGALLYYFLLLSTHFWSTPYLSIFLLLPIT